MLRGPNVELYRAVTRATTAPVIASGGISCIEDLVVLARPPQRREPRGLDRRQGALRRPVHPARGARAMRRINEAPRFLV